MKSAVPRRSLQGEEKNGHVLDIPVDSIVFNPYQPRAHIDEDAFRQLCESIREYGLMQPVVVRRLGSGYELVAGERRVRAFKTLGMKRIPAMVRDLDDKEMAVLALVENLQRENLNAIEEAEGYLKLMREFHFTQEQVADYVGRSQSGVANKIRLLRLPGEIKEAISGEIINERQARALLRLGNDGDQLRAFREIVEGKLNVEQTERLVESMSRGDSVQKGKNSRRGRTKGRTRALAVIRDLRIYLNSIKDIIRTMKESGLEVAFEEADRGGCLEVTIKISKSAQVGGGEKKQLKNASP